MTDRASSMAARTPRRALVPLDPDTPVLQRLLQALRGGGTFNVHGLYDTSLKTFEMALQVLQAWRLQRYYRGAAVPAAHHVH